MSPAPPPPTAPRAQTAGHAGAAPSAARANRSNAGAPGDATSREAPTSNPRGVRSPGNHTRQAQARSRLGTVPLNPQPEKALFIPQIDYVQMTSSRNRTLHQLLLTKIVT